MDTKVCPIHGVDMQGKEGKYGHFYSHKVQDGTWCNGKVPEQKFSNPSYSTQKVDFKRFDNSDGQKKGNAISNAVLLACHGKIQLDEIEKWANKIYTLDPKKFVDHTASDPSFNEKFEAVAENLPF